MATSPPFIIAGKRPTENPGTQVKVLPAAPWEYRIQDYGGGWVYAEFFCVETNCSNVFSLRMDASGRNTMGAVVCPGCGQKAYARIDGIWFEVG